MKSHIYYKGREPGNTDYSAVGYSLSPSILLSFISVFIILLIHFLWELCATHLGANGSPPICTVAVSVFLSRSKVHYAIKNIRGVPGSKGKVKMGLKMTFCYLYPSFRFHDVTSQHPHSFHRNDFPLVH